MVEHVVCFKLKPGTTPEQETELLRLIYEMKETIPTVVELSAGRNFSERGQGYGIGLRVLFHDRAGLDVYATHPGHQPTKDFVKGIGESTLVMDYER